MSEPEKSISEKFPGLSEADREEIALDFLENLTPGFQKPEVFRQLARLAGLDTVEVVPVRTSPEDEESIEVLLGRRPADDIFWPNLLHPVGSVIREDDPIEHIHDFRPAFSRAMAELGAVEFTHEPVEIETVHRRGNRSREITVRFWGEIEGEPASGEFHDAAGIARRAPELGIFDDHAAYIERVARAYDSFRADRAG